MECRPNFLELFGQFFPDVIYLPSRGCFKAVGSQAVGSQGVRERGKKNKKKTMEIAPFAGQTEPP